MTEHQPQTTAVVRERVPVQDLPQFFGQALHRGDAGGPGPGQAPGRAAVLALPRHANQRRRRRGRLPGGQADQRRPRRDAERPAGQVVEGMHVGPYDTLPQTYEEVGAYMNERGLSPSSDMWRSTSATRSASPTPRPGGPRSSGPSPEPPDDSPRLTAAASNADNRTPARSSRDFSAEVRRQWDPGAIVGGRGRVECAEPAGMIRTLDSQGVRTDLDTGCYGRSASTSEQRRIRCTWEQEDSGGPWLPVRAQARHRRVAREGEDDRGLSRRGLRRRGLGHIRDLPNPSEAAG